MPPTPSPSPQRSPLRLVLLALAAVTVLAMGGLMLVVARTGSTEVAYQNDDYQVPPPDSSPPPIPVPRSVEEARDLLTRNPIYAQTAPVPVRCNARPINAASASDDQLESHFDNLIECLMRVWQPPVTGAGFQVVRPTVTIYGSGVTTRCGTGPGGNAFYCSADQQLYYSNQLPETVPIVAQEKWAADLIMAHEFAHSVQGRTGIKGSRHVLMEMSDDATDLELGRRAETQADCFAGMFLRSVSQSLGVQQSDLKGIEATYVAVGDDTLSGDPNHVGGHGRAQSRMYWGRTGLGTSDIGQCNTFVARSEQVR